MKRGQLLECFLGIWIYLCLKPTSSWTFQSQKPVNTPLDLKLFCFCHLYSKRPKAQAYVKYSLTVRLKVGLQGKRTE